MQTIRIAAALLVVLATAACGSDVVAPEAQSAHQPASGATTGTGTVAAPGGPSFGGNYLGSGY